MKINSSNVYFPEEDSKLLLKCVKNYLRTFGDLNALNICEVGVGSGFVSLNLAKSFSNLNFFGSDINRDAINLTQNEFDHNNFEITLKNKSLLTGFNKSLLFDLVIFNTPYFPFEDKNDTFEKISMKDRAIYGGRYGYEVIENFIYQLNDKLNNSGACFMIYSSLTKPLEIEKILKNNLFEFEYIDSDNSFFEKILCVKIWKSQVLKDLFDLKIKNLSYLSSGKHSIVLEGFYKNYKSIIKVGKPQHLDKEAFFEEKLESEDFIPKMFLNGNGFVVREKVEGILIVDFFEKGSKKNILNVLGKILMITQRLDELGINKFEMTNPYKHIYILDDLNVKFIDFERCIFTNKPKNTTQVLEFFKRYSPILSQKKIYIDDFKVMNISKKYKKKHFVFGVNDILKD